MLHELWSLARGWSSRRRRRRGGESGGQETTTSSPDTTVAPVQHGIVSDILYFIHSFFFSLFPAWEPVPANQPTGVQ